MKRFLLLTTFFFLSACTQEIRPAAPLPAVTELAIATVPAPGVATAAPTSTLVATPTPTRYPPPAALPAGPISLIAIGDSLTFGVGDDTLRGYPGRLLEIISEMRPGSTLTNFAQPGWTSRAVIDGEQGLFGQLPRAVAETEAALSQGRGAVVFVWVGENDLWDLYEGGGDVGDELEDRNAQGFSANIDAILSGLRRAGAEVVVALLDDPSRRPVALQSEAFPGITADELGRMSLHVQRYNRIIAEKAARYGALTVDLSSTDIFTNPATLSADGRHPNRAGYDLVAQAWYEVLSTLLD